MMSAEELPSRLVVVSEAVSDAEPRWSLYILELSREGNEWMARAVRVAPFVACSRWTTVKAVSKKVPDGDMKRWLGERNPCAVNAAELQAEMKKRKGRAAEFEAVRGAIAAECAGREQVLWLPYPANVNWDALKKRQPKVAAWWEFGQDLEERIFGLGNVFRSATEEQEDVQAAGGRGSAARSSSGPV
jgi:hypothetical protein